MQKWEYKVRDWVGKGWDGDINFRAAYKLLSEMGEEGWELVAIKDGVAIFKRPEQEQLKHYMMITRASAGRST